MLHCMATNVCPNTTANEHLLTSEFADALRVHVESVRRFIRQKRVRAIKVGRHWRIPRSELDRIQQAGGL